MKRNQISDLWYVFLLLFCACSPDTALEKALQEAGTNRAELEKVLEHYREEPEKLQAAQFLIENMPYHYYYEHKDRGVTLDNLQAEMEKADTSVVRMWKFKKRSRLFSEGVLANDAATISASYLIKNIDQAFYVWKKQPWGKHISFEQFCREILPYRIGDEDLVDWRDTYYDYFQPILDSLLTEPADPVKACRLIYDTIVARDWIFMDNLSAPRLGADVLLKYRIGGCREYSDILVYAMRALGIPGGTDILIQNPDKRYKTHYWNYMRDTTGRMLEYELYKSFPQTGYRDTTRKRAKIYRYCFEMQAGSFPLEFKQKALPASLKNPFIMDVTDEYFPEMQLSIDLQGEKIVDDVLYLCVFNNRIWIPISMTNIKNGIADFGATETKIIYQAAFYVNDTLIPVSSPFLFEKRGKLHYWMPDTLHRQEVHLLRKYPQSNLWYEPEDYIIGGELQCANRADFVDAVTLYTIPEDIEMKFYEIEVKNSNPFRYARYIAPGPYLNLMAELEFYAEGGKRLTGEVLGTDGVKGDNPALDKYTVFDGDPLTYFKQQTPSGCWAGLDFGEKHRLTKLKFILKNDDNQIKENELYELFYFDDNGQAVSLGQCVGDSKQALVYRNVPANALLWLQNHTKGQEERIFTYENAKQIWW